jgi:hypothetical protein
MATNSPLSLAPTRVLMSLQKNTLRERPVIGKGVPSVYWL